MDMRSKRSAARRNRLAACDGHKDKERKIKIQQVNTPSESASFSGHKALHVAAVTQRETVPGI